MQPFIIPHEITKGEKLVVLPKRTYDRLIRFEKTATKMDTGKRSHTVLDPDLAEALEDVKAGRMSGPFATAEELIIHLRKEN